MDLANTFLSDITLYSADYEELYWHILNICIQSAQTFILFYRNINISEADCFHFAFKYCMNSFPRGELVHPFVHEATEKPIAEMRGIIKPFVKMMASGKTHMKLEEGEMDKFTGDTGKKNIIHHIYQRSSMSSPYDKLFWWKFSWLAIRIPHPNSCTLKLKQFAFLANHCDICLGACRRKHKWNCKEYSDFGVQLNLSGTFEQIIWLAE